MAQKTSIMVSSTFKTVAMMTILTSVLWTAYGIYSALNKPAEVNVSAEILAPLNPTIDEETLNKLKERRQIAEVAMSDEMLQQVISLLATNEAKEQTETVVEEEAEEVIPVVNEVTVATPSAEETVSPVDESSL